MIDITPVIVYTHIYIHVMLWKRSKKEEKAMQYIQQKSPNRAFANTKMQMPQTAELLLKQEYKTSPHMERRTYKPQTPRSQYKCSGRNYWDTHHSQANGHHC